MKDKLHKIIFGTSDRAIFSFILIIIAFDVLLAIASLAVEGKLGVQDTHQGVDWSYFENAGSKRTTKKSSSVSSSQNKGTSTKHYYYHSSYDDGYDAIYEDDDFDWDRYFSDDDYASGVDDAMEDIDW